MKIEYKTEGRLELHNRNSLRDVVVVKWLKGSTSVNLHHDDVVICLSKGQLTQLATMAATICDDIEPNMGSLPRGTAE